MTIPTWLTLNRFHRTLEQTGGSLGHDAIALRKRCFSKEDAVLARLKREREASWAEEPMLGIQKKVVRCSVCTHVHDVTALLDLKPLGNGTFTFICPIRKTGGCYQLEQIGTLKIGEKAIRR